MTKLCLIIAMSEKGKGIKVQPQVRDVELNENTLHVCRFSIWCICNIPGATRGRVRFLYEQDLDLSKPLHLCSHVAEGSKGGRGSCPPIIWKIL